MKKETTKVENKEITFLKGLYTDFKNTMTSVFGDAEEVFKKHKLLIILAFFAFLLYRNKQFTIEQFVKKLEERIKEKEYGE